MVDFRGLLDKSSHALCLCLYSSRIGCILLSSEPNADAVADTFESNLFIYLVVIFIPMAFTSSEWFGPFHE